MKIMVFDFPKDVRVSMEAENEAEVHQLEAIEKLLADAQTNAGRWCNMEGETGVTIVAMKETPRTL